MLIAGIRQNLTRCAAVLGVLVLTAPAVLAVASVRADPPPIEAYGKLPAIEQIALSPAGTRAAFVRTRDDTRFVAVFDFGQNKLATAVRVADQKLRDISWIDDNLLLIVASSTTRAWGVLGGSREWEVAQILDTRTSKLRPVDVRVENVETMNTVSGTPLVRRVNGRTMLLVRGRYANEDYLRSGLFWFDPDNGRSTVAAKGEYVWEQWLVDDDGTVVVNLSYTDTNKHWRLRTRTTDRLLTTMTGEDEFGPPELVGLTREPGYALVTVRDGDHHYVRRLALNTGKIGDIDAQANEFAEMLMDRGSSRVVGGIADDGGKYVFFDPDRQRKWSSIVAAYPGARVKPVSYTDDFSKVVVLVDGAELGYYYEIFDLTARRGIPVSAVYDGITKTAPAKAITYAAKDDFKVPAILTVPRDREAKNLPLVVFPHGGPMYHDTLEFDWWREALAEAGYAVLQPNYRGSDIDGDFLAAGYGEFGRKMQTDLSDGVRYLAAQGTIDPKRVCIVGASYGGYAALAGVTLDPGVYRCAVSVAGIGDLARFLRWQVENRLATAPRYWDRYLGITGPRDPLVQTISPISHVDAITVPVLLIHGKDDTVVPYEQSEVMRDAMQKAGKPVEFVTLKKEDHWLSGSVTRSQMLEATLDFLRRNNPP